MSEPLISVIVPIYNVEPYLRECVDSIVAQNYSNLEILLVDDGSADKCPEICDEYAKKDNRVKVIHQDNGGLAHARNVGIANSSGDYLTFVDSDDYVSNDYVECLYKGIAESGADISIASFYPFKNDIVCQRTSELCAYEIISKEDAISRYCSINAERSMPFISACNKIYCKSLFDGILFPKGKLYEDSFTTYKLVDRAEKIVYSKAQLYYYRLNPQSIQGLSFKENHIEMVDAFRSGLDYFNEKGEIDFSTKFVPPLLMREIYCWWGTKQILKNERMSQKILIDYRNDCKQLKYGKNVGLLWVFIFKLISFCPQLYCLYRMISPSYVGDR